MKSPVPKHSITIAGHRTAVSLEGEFWNCLREIANRRGEAVAALVASIDKDRRGGTAGSLSSAIRLFILRDHQHRVGTGGLPSSRWTLWSRPAAVTSNDFEALADAHTANDDTSLNPN